MTTRIFRWSQQDALVLGAALVQGAMLGCGLSLAAGGGLAAKGAVVLFLGLGMNWGSNTVSHIHLHAPLFRSQAANRGFSIYLSVLLAVPQSWWKLRHLQHHGLLWSCTRHDRRGLVGQGALELGALLTLVGPLLALAPRLFATTYLPAMLLGFGLCAVQGRQEHVRSEAGVDVHARVYNRLWFNDGFHAAHHRRPEAHWTTLPEAVRAADVVSALPPIVRWLERWLEALPPLINRLAAGFVDRLERLTLNLAVARWFLVRTHQRAWKTLLTHVDARTVRRVTIVGGGLFPRTALVLARLLPAARLTIVDAVPAHLQRARLFLQATTVRDACADIRFVARRYEPNDAELSADLVIIPLAFRGDRTGLYQQPPAPLLAVHDWLWRPRGHRSVRVSWLLLKRLNLVIGPPKRDA